MTDNSTPSPSSPSPQEREKAWARALRLDASGEHGRISSTECYAIAEYLEALAASPSQEKEQNDMPDTRLAELPLVTHGDLPRPATGLFGETLPEKIRTIITDFGHLTDDDIQCRPITERYYSEDCIDSILALLDESNEAQEA